MTCALGLVPASASRTCRRLAAGICKNRPVRVQEVRDTAVRGEGIELLVADTKSVSGPVTADPVRIRVVAVREPVVRREGYVLDLRPDQDTGVHRGGLQSETLRR